MNMVQWTEEPIRSKAPQRSNDANASEPFPVQRKAKTSRKSARGILYIMVLVMVCAMIPAGYYFFTQPSAPLKVAGRDQTDRDLTTGRIVISDPSGCRERGFNNQSGYSIERGTIQCTALLPRGQGLPERLDTIRKSFAPQ